MLKSSLKAFEAPEAWLAATKNLPGYYFYGDAMYRGENRAMGAMISYYTADTGKVTVEVRDNNGKMVKSMETDAVKGFNRFTWRLDRDALPQATYPTVQQQPDAGMRNFRSYGGAVIPGTYTVALKREDDSTATVVKVNADHRMEAPDTDALRKNFERAEAFGARITALNEKLGKIKTVRESLAKSEEIIKNNPGFAETMTTIHKTVKEEVVKLDEAFGRRQTGLVSRINGYRSLLMATGVPSQQEEKGMTDAEAAIEEAERMIDKFLSGPWAEYVETLKKINLTGDAVVLR
jgi:hypothetical protein